MTISKRSSANVNMNYMMVPWYRETGIQLFCCIIMILRRRILINLNAAMNSKNIMND